jgi:hypothetical protein
MPRPRGTVASPPLAHSTPATILPQPSTKRGFDYAPEEKNWELYYSLPLGIFITIAGLIMLVASIRSMQSAFASSSWTSSTATILSAELIESRGRRGRVHYDAKVTYVYTVGGQSYSGTRISFSAYGASITGEDVVAKYAPGTQHPCYYDPDRPAECVLEKGTFAFTYFFPILAVVVTVGGGLWAFQCGMSIWHRLS